MPCASEVNSSGSLLFAPGLVAPDYPSVWDTVNEDNVFNNFDAPSAPYNLLPDRQLDLKKRWERSSPSIVANYKNSVSVMPLTYCGLMGIGSATKVNGACMNYVSNYMLGHRCGAE